MMPVLNASTIKCKYTKYKFFEQKESDLGIKT